MKKFFYLGLLSLVILGSCNSDSFTKFKDGTEYKIISDGKGKKIMPGNFFEVEVLKKYKDSVLFDSRDIIPQFAMYDTAQFPPLYKELFKNVRVGDSIVTKLVTDSVYKLGNLPPFEKKHEYETTTYKIVDIFETREQTDSVYNKLLPLAKLRSVKKVNEQIKKKLQTDQAQLNTDDKILQDYIAANKLSAVKAPWGTYVVITNPGTGEALTDTSILSVNYTGKTLDGKTFDSNTDPAFKHIEPLTIDLGQVGNIILGWTDGLKLLKKGAKARLLIPSSLGYGDKGSGDKIKPNENLIFDVEVLDVLNSVQFTQQQMQLQKDQQQKQMEMQQEQIKKMQEQMKKDSAKKK